MLHKTNSHKNMDVKLYITVWNKMCRELVTICIFHMGQPCLILSNKGLENFTVISRTIILNPIVQSLLGHLQKALLDLDHVNLEK